MQQGPEGPFFIGMGKSFQPARHNKIIFIFKINRNIAINIPHMGATKADEFTVKDNRLAKYAKALSHPARIAILRLLLKKQACICGDIVDELPLSQSTVSQHLKELKAAGLIKGDIEGTRVCYCIDEKEWKQAGKVLQELFAAYEAFASKCC
jgi:DNA-binding transcriptional ArsR family regulator